MNNNTSDNNNEISLKEIILKFISLRNYLLKQYKVIILAGFIGGAIGLTYATLKKPVYVAELSFALEDAKSSSLGAYSNLASQFGMDLGGGGGGAFSGDNLMELMQSRVMVEKALLTTVNLKEKNETLAELYISFNGFRKSWNSNPGLKNITYPLNADRSTFTLQQDSILGSFYNSIIKTNLSVDKTDKKASIISVIVTSNNELFSKLFAETLAKTVSDFYINTITKKSVENVRILQHQTDSVRRELNDAIKGVASSMDATPNANPLRQILKAPSQSRQVDVQADQAILTELVKNLEVSKVSLRKETPLIQVIDAPILPLEKQKPGRMKGSILGGLVGGFIAIIIILISKTYKTILND